MKLEKKIEINLFDFFKNGTFDYIKLGQTKEWILNNFPDPDNDMGNNLLSKKNNIWLYGNIEFHFTKDNLLYTIFSDNFHNFSGGESLKIDLWLINEDNLKLINVIKILNSNNIDYEKTCAFETIRVKLSSGVELGF